VTAAALAAPNATRSIRLSAHSRSLITYGSGEPSAARDPTLESEAVVVSPHSWV